MQQLKKYHVTYNLLCFHDSQNVLAEALTSPFALCLMVTLDKIMGSLQFKIFTVHI